MVAIPFTAQNQFEGNTICAYWHLHWCELMWDECHGNDGKCFHKSDIFSLLNIFFLWKEAECKASRKHDHRNCFFSTSFWDLWCSILFRIPQKSKEMRLVSLKPYAHFLNNWEEPCCDQDDFTEVDPGTSNYNRCEITPYLPLKLHWNSEAVCGNNTKRCLSFCLEIFFLLFGFHGGRGAYHICSADKTASVLP